MVPADNPELVMVVMIDEPRNGEYFGGLVAAPVFSQVMSSAMRLLDIAPDRVSKEQLMRVGSVAHDELKAAANDGGKV